MDFNFTPEEEAFHQELRTWLQSNLPEGYDPQKFDEIDDAVKLGLRHPMGPFELLDHTGLDINLHVANVFYDEFKDPNMAPPPLLRRMGAAGHLGRKTGKGFYEYDEKGQRRSST